MLQNRIATWHPILGTNELAGGCRRFQRGVLASGHGPIRNILHTNVVRFIGKPRTRLYVAGPAERAA